MSSEQDNSTVDFNNDDLFADNPWMSTPALSSGDTAVLTVLGLLGIFLLVATTTVSWKGEVKMPSSRTRISRSKQRMGRSARNVNEQNQNNSPKPSIFAVMSAKFHPVMIPTLSAFIACVLSITVHLTCQFLAFSPDTGFDGVGLWSASFTDDEFGTGGSCLSTINTQFYVDSELVLARTCAIMATVLGTIPVLYLLCTVARGQYVFGSLIRIMSVPLVCAFVFQMATLAVRAAYPCRGRESCQLDRGAFFSLVSAAYWLLAAVGVVTIPLADDFA